MVVFFKNSPARNVKAFWHDLPRQPFLPTRGNPGEHTEFILKGPLHLQCLTIIVATCLAEDVSKNLNTLISEFWACTVRKSCDDTALRGLQVGVRTNFVREEPLDLRCLTWFGPCVSWKTYPYVKEHSVFGIFRNFGVIHFDLGVSGYCVGSVSSPFW